MRTSWSLCIIGLVVSLCAFAARQSGKILGEGKEKLKITLTAPKGGWTVDRMVQVAGETNDPTVNPVTVNINGDRYLLKTVNGAFKRKFPVSSGKNSIVVSGTNQAGTTKAERTVYAQVPGVAMMLVLTSDTDGVYTDLHVYEPLPSLKDPLGAEGAKKHEHVFWAMTNSKSGGMFYLNEQGGDFDSPGFGPYLYTHTSPPLGVYRVDTNYWPSGDKAHTVAYLNIVLFGGTPSEQKRSVQYPLVMPGETSTLAWIRIDKEQKAFIYVPTLDEKPTDTKIWPNWVLEAKTRRMRGEDSSEDYPL